MDEYIVGNPVVEVSSLVAGYKKKVALHELDLVVRAGMVTGLLGSNGAGKSTLLMTMASLLKPMKGSVKVGGYLLSDRKQVSKARRELSFLPQNFTVDESLTVEQFVSYSLWLREYPKSKIDQATCDALDMTHLQEWSNTRISQLSGGLHQRVGLAAVCAGSPALIILDEPTVGLDPEQRAHFRQVIRRIAEDGSAVVLSTHIVEDVVSVCQGLVVLADGQITYCGDSGVLTAEGDRGVDSAEAAYSKLLHTERG